MKAIRILTLLVLISTQILGDCYRSTSSPSQIPETFVHEVDNLHAAVNSLVVGIRKKSAQLGSGLRRIRSNSHIQGPYMEILERIEAMESLRGPTIIYFDTASSNRAISDILFSAHYFRSVLADPYSTLENRAEAIASLMSLPQSNLFFNTNVRQAWREVVLMTGDSKERAILVEAYTNLSPQYADLPMLREIAVSSTFPDTRAGAVKALGRALEKSGDTSLHALITWIQAHDENARVSHFAEEALR